MSQRPPFTCPSCGHKEARDLGDALPPYCGMCGHNRLPAGDSKPPWLPGIQMAEKVAVRNVLSLRSASDPSDVVDSFIRDVVDHHATRAAADYQRKADGLERENSSLRARLEEALADKARLAAQITQTFVSGGDDAHYLREELTKRKALGWQINHELYEIERTWKAIEATRRTLNQAMDDFCKTWREGEATMRTHAVSIRSKAVTEPEEPEAEKKRTGLAPNLCLACANQSDVPGSHHDATCQLYNPDLDDQLDDDEHPEGCRCEECN